MVPICGDGKSASPAEYIESVKDWIVNNSRDFNSGTLFSKNSAIRQLCDILKAAYGEKAAYYYKLPITHITPAQAALPQKSSNHILSFVSGTVSIYITYQSTSSNNNNNNNNKKTGPNPF